MTGSGVRVVAGFAVGATYSFAASSAVFGIPFMTQRMKASIASGLRWPLGGITPIRFFTGIFRIRDRRSLDDLQQVAVRVAGDDVLVLVVAGGQDLLIRGHEVIVAVLACPVAGDAVALHDRCNVHIIRRHFPIGQRREQRLQRLLREAQNGHPTCSA